MSDNDVKRVPVDFNYNAINPDFLHALAQIAKYAEEKYGSWEQYTNARLTGEKGCVNHIYNHLREYQLGKKHDKFGSLKMQLAAIAYNAMMEFFYLEKFGPVEHPLRVDVSHEDLVKALMTVPAPPAPSETELPRLVPRFKVGAVDGEKEEG